MKKITKLTAAVTALTVAAVSAISVATTQLSARAESIDEPPFTAYMCMQAGSDAVWTADGSGTADNMTDVVSAQITGDGAYSVSATMANGSGSIELMILETNINAYAYAPEDAASGVGGLPVGCSVNIAVDSVVVQQASGDSYEIAYSGPSEGALRCSDDGSSMRVNLLNNWTSPAISDIPSDMEEYGGLAAGDVVTINFTVSGMDAAIDTPTDTTTTAPATTTAPPTTTTPTGEGDVEADPYGAWLVMNTAGAWFNDDAATASPVTVIPGLGGDGTYTATLTLPSDFVGSESISCFYLATNINAYAYVEDGLDPWEYGSANITIDSITIDHVLTGNTSTIAYNGPSEGAFSKENNGTDLRVNILNTWTNPGVSDISPDLDEGMVAGDTITVTFTVSGINEPYDNGEPEVTTTTTTKKPTTTTTTTETEGSNIKGDFDGDGDVDIQDAFQTLMVYANQAAGIDVNLTAAQSKAVDVDGDGKITIQDAFKILMYYAQSAAGNTPSWN